MKTLSDKMAASIRVLKKDETKILRSMAREGVTFFRKEVWPNKGSDVQPKTVNGGRWAPRKNKKSRKFILTDTGTLRRSITKIVNKSDAFIYTLVSYARYHNEGTNKMPQRKFLGESETLNRRFRVIILRHIQKALEK
jgi:phage gpG-like protein